MAMAQSRDTSRKREKEGRGRKASPKETTEESGVAGEMPVVVGKLERVDDIR